MTVSTALQSLRVAVLINTYNGPTIALMKKSFTEAIRSASPGAQVNFYDPIEAQVYPNPSSYDLIVLSGGTEDMTVSKPLPWVAKMKDFLKSTTEAWPDKKLMGICWGHQTICVAFGGIVEALEKAELGITTVPLTPTGASFFKSSELHIHEFHKRKIRTAAPGFKALAEHNQSFINARNTIITFQGHPEANSDYAKKMLETAPSYMCVDGEEKKSVAKAMEGEHDGSNIWRRVIQWVGEEPVAI